MYTSIKVHILYPFVLLKVDKSSYFEVFNVL